MEILAEILNRVNKELNSEIENIRCDLDYNDNLFCSDEDREYFNKEYK